MKAGKWIIIGLVAIIIIVIVFIVVAKNAETKRAAANQASQAQLLSNALAYKMNADNIAAAEHGTAFEWFESMNNAIEGFGGIWGSFSAGGK